MPSDGASWSLPDAVAEWLQTVAETVRSRNAAYGDSAIDPIRVFSRSSPDEQLRVRIDDKLSRVARGAGATPDTLVDLVGYIAILAVMQQRSAGSVASQVSLPYVEDATLPPPQRTPAPDATACLRPGRAPVLLSSAMPDDDSHALTDRQAMSPLAGVRSVDEALAVAAMMRSGGR